MDISSLLTIAAQSFIQSKGSGTTGSGLDASSVVSALSGLVGNKDGGLDISYIISGMQGGDMGGMLMSWMGSGSNDSISSSQIASMFDSDKISAFSDALGLSSEEAVGGLQDAIPSMVDNATNDSSLLDSVGGIEGAMKLAGKFF